MLKYALHQYYDQQVQYKFMIWKMKPFLPQQNGTRFRLKCLMLCLVLQLLISVSGMAQVRFGHTIPLYHWADGYNNDVFLRAAIKPFFKYTLPVPFATIDISPPVSRNPYALFLSNRLASLRPRSTSLPILLLGGVAIPQFGNLPGTSKTELSYRFLNGLKFSRHFTVMNSLLLDQGLKKNAGYVGKTWNGLTVLTDQAYGILHYDTFHLKLGRDFIKWGRGEDATLLFSDYSRPFDHINFQIRSQKFQFTYNAVQLDDKWINSADASLIGSPKVSRYISAGRLDFSFLRGRLQASVSQAVLFGSSSGFRLTMLNPFLVYHGEILNDGLTANSFGSIDISLWPIYNVELYAELLVDDIQIEKKIVSDLEPDEIGFIVGTRMADVGGVSGFTAGLEYTRVTNRTYQTSVEFEKYLHRNQPVGHFLGNDFDRWLLYGRKYLGHNLLFGLKAEYVRQGEGRISSEWDAPWLDATLATGYSEPFPTGIVEKKKGFQFSLRWHPKASQFAEIVLQQAHFDNFQNRNDAKSSNTALFLRFWFDWNVMIPMH